MGWRFKHPHLDQYSVFTYLTTARVNQALKHASGFLPVKTKKRTSAFAEVRSLKNPDFTSKMPLHLNWLMLLAVLSGITVLNFS